MTTLPQAVQKLVADLLQLTGRLPTQDNEVLVLKTLLKYGAQDLAEGTSPNPQLLTENMKWFRVRLDELGAGEVRA